MSGFYGPDPLKVVQNTATLERERTRQRAARAKARPFTAVSLPLLMLAGLLNGWTLLHPAAHLLQGLGRALLFVVIGIGCAGAWRIRAYLKAHPTDVR